MDCKEFQDHLFAYTEGELLPEKRRAMETHARECLSCGRLLEGFRVMEATIQREREVEPNPFATTRIMQHLENEDQRRSRQVVSVLRPVALALALFLALSIGFIIGNHGLSRTERVSSGQEIETLRTDLYISDFVDEDIPLLSIQ
jgi:anti-sigma factor RsiW